MYVYKYFFVKPSSTFPVEKIDTYFVDRCNYYQKDADKGDYIIGSLFNAREMQQIMFFSDVTRDAHKMDTNVIYVTQSVQVSEPDPKPLTPLSISNELIIKSSFIPSIIVPTDEVKGIIVT